MFANRVFFYDTHKYTKANVWDWWKPGWLHIFPILQWNVRFRKYSYCRSYCLHSKVLLLVDADFRNMPSWKPYTCDDVLLLMLEVKMLFNWEVVRLYYNMEGRLTSKAIQVFLYLLNHGYLVIFYLTLQSPFQGLFLICCSNIIDSTEIDHQNCAANLKATSRFRRCYIAPLCL